MAASSQCCLCDVCLCSCSSFVLITREICMSMKQLDHHVFYYWGVLAVLNSWLWTFWNASFALPPCPFLTSKPRAELLGHTLMFNSTKWTSTVVPVLISSATSTSSPTLGKFFILATLRVAVICISLRTKAHIMCSLAAWKYSFNIWKHALLCKRKSKKHFILESKYANLTFPFLFIFHAVSEYRCTPIPWQETI